MSPRAAVSMAKRCRPSVWHRLLFSSLLCSAALGQDLTPRRPHAKRPLQADPDLEQRLAVKFVDGALVRAAQDGSVFSRAGRDLAAVSGLMIEHGFTFRPVFSRSEERLRAFEERAAVRSGKAQPDLAGMLFVEFRGAASAEKLVAAGTDLQELDVVEYAAIETLNIPPPSHDPSPATDDFVPEQTYRDADPGIDVDFAWSQGAAKGGGIRLTDCEYSWRLDHEDLHDVSITVESGQTPTTDQIEHGTAVLGIICAKENDYGCSGIAPDAEIYVYPQYTAAAGDRRKDSIEAACQDSADGDIVLLEMQSFEGAPAETLEDIWDVTKVCTDPPVARTR